MAQPHHDGKPAGLLHPFKDSVQTHPDLGGARYSGCRRRTSAHNQRVAETFIGEAIVPEGMSFAVSSMTAGGPGLPRTFSWRDKKFTISEILDQWKEAGDCHHGSGERYVRKHWFRIRTRDGLEMNIYFERQRRSSGGSRWRLYTMQSSDEGS